jgi:hypothetical protein
MKKYLIELDPDEKRKVENVLAAGRDAFKRLYGDKFFSINADYQRALKKISGAKPVHLELMKHHPEVVPAPAAVPKQLTAKHTS